MLKKDVTPLLLSVALPVSLSVACNSSLLPHDAALHV
jgi:hypothetical protein